MDLHMYYIVWSMLLFLACRGGHIFFFECEWVCKTVHPSRGTPHWHIAAWDVCHGILARLAGRSGTAVVFDFVRFLEVVFQA